MPTWWTRETMNIDGEIRTALAAQGLGSYRRLAAYTGGRRVSRAHKRAVRTLDLMVDGQQKTYFLKQSSAEPARAVWRALRKGRLPHSVVLKEVLILTFLRERGIPVMRAVAWGEKRLLGWPVGGFLLVEEVRGQAFPELFNMSGSRLRRRMMRTYGSLVGHLHQTRIDARVRPRDLVCVSTAFADYSRSLVLIDRERGKAVHVDMPLDRCAVQLADLFVVGVLDITRLHTSEILAFFAGYFSANPLPREHRRQLTERARTEAVRHLAGDCRYADAGEILGRLSKSR